MRRKFASLLSVFAALLMLAVTLQSCNLTGTYKIDIPIDAIFRLDSILKKDSVVILQSRSIDSSDYSMITISNVDLEESNLTVVKRPISKTKALDLEKAGFTPRVTVPRKGSVYTIWARSNLDNCHDSRE